MNTVCRRMQKSSILTVPASHHTGDPSMKARRQDLILELIDREPLHNQEELRRRLLQRGCEATQATISRDIKELALVKRAGDGAYQRSNAEATNPETALTALERATGEFLRRVEQVHQRDLRRGVSTTHLRHAHADSKEAKE